MSVGPNLSRIHCSGWWAIQRGQDPYGIDVLWSNWLRIDNLMAIDKSDMFFGHRFILQIVFGLVLSILAATSSCSCEPCLSSNDCEPGKVCVESSCRLECSSSGDCSGGETCFEGACLPLGAPCQDTRDCLTTEICVQRRCRLLCLSNQDCLENERCLGYACISVDCPQGTSCDDAGVRPVDASSGEDGGASDARGFDAGELVQLLPRSLTVGGYHSCAMIEINKRAKCWGQNSYGQLGIGDRSHRGDTPGEMGIHLPLVSLEVFQLQTGGFHSCGIVDENLVRRVKCWGLNRRGQLGTGDGRNRGETLYQVGDDLFAVNLGRDRVGVQLSAGVEHTCALLDDGNIKCWGDNNHGQLGQGDTMARGSIPAHLGNGLLPIELGGQAVAVVSGLNHNCAILQDSELKCWGANHSGQLGQADTEHRGDQAGEMGAALDAVDIGRQRSVLAVALGGQHSCAILDNNSVKCWGGNDYGQLGLGDREHRGDDPEEMGDNLPTVPLGRGRSAVAISLGMNHSCVVMDNGAIKCWGANTFGQLGLGDAENRGDDPGEMGDNLPEVNAGLDSTARQVSAGYIHTCALSATGVAKCWGYNTEGELGQGDSSPRGLQSEHMGDNLPTLDFGLQSFRTE